MFESVDTRIEKSAFMLKPISPRTSCLLFGGVSNCTELVVQICDLLAKGSFLFFMIPLLESHWISSILDFLYERREKSWIHVSSSQVSSLSAMSSAFDALQSLVRPL